MIYYHYNGYLLSLLFSLLDFLKQNYRKKKRSWKRLTPKGALWGKKWFDLSLCLNDGFVRVC